MSGLRITAGLGCIDDYEPFVQAGADELFAGYVPEEWTRRFGARTPMNRREVLMYNTQLGSMSELMILSEMVRTYKVPVALAFNFPVYTNAQREYLAGLAKTLAGLGFTEIIAADEKLIGMLTSSRVHVSGEYGEINRLNAALLRRAGAKRIIFPRQTAIEEMRSVIAHVPDMEYEAFVLNERCHFTGAYCASLHRDELCHMCRVPYRLPGFPETEREPREGFAAAGCGLCALGMLEAAGITHIKLVSRGNDTKSTVRDIQMLRRALDTRPEEIRRVFFGGGCPGECYYGTEFR